MSLRPGDVYVRASGDRRKYRVRVVSEIADLVVLEAADWTKVISTFHDFKMFFIRARL
jgi:hypothetical protein